MFGELLGAGISAAANFGLSQLNYENQKKLAAQQNQYNIDMWRMNNEYNTPAAQMQRFQDAGLNPNLIYGQGSAGNSNSAPQQVVPNAPDYSHAMSDISKFGQLLDIANRLEMYRGQVKENALRDERKQLISNQNQIAAAKGAQEWGKSIAMGEYGTADDLFFRNSQAGFFRKLYNVTFDRLARSNMLTSARTALAATQETLNNLQSNYYRVRNAWQPWQYGVGMAGDVVGMFNPIKNLFSSGKQAIKNFNNTNNYYAY